MVSKDDWDLRSNIKAKPGSQGTLFSGGRSQMPDRVRYKKGYNPQRQREIEQATGGTGVQSRIVDRVSRGHGSDTKPDIANTPWTRETRETLKRSSVPPEHLSSVFIQRMRRDDPMAGGLLDGANGIYQGIGRSTGNILIAHDAHQPTVLHEIGHHASNLEGTTHSRYHAPYQRGLEEGSADRYVDEHAPEWSTNPFHRDRFADAHRRGLGDYQPNRQQTTDSRDGSNRADDFARGYAHARPVETRVPNSNDRWREINNEYDARKAADILHAVDNPQLPGMDANSRLRRTGPWEGVKP